MGLSNSSYALDINFQVWAWGDNASGELGDNSRTSKSSPVLVVGSHSFVEVYGGGYHSIARKSDGSVWAWGDNASGQLGDNSVVSKSSPVLVVGSIPFVTLDSFEFISGSTCWGHDTGVTQTNVRDFIENWQGGGSITGTGDAEKITLDLVMGESRVSEIVNTGAVLITLGKDSY